MYIITQLTYMLVIIDQSPVNPYLTDGLFRYYHLGETTFILGASGVIFKFYSIFR